MTKDQIDSIKNASTIASYQAVMAAESYDDETYAETLETAKAEAVELLNKFLS